MSIMGIPTRAKYCLGLITLICLVANKAVLSPWMRQDDSTSIQILVTTLNFCVFNALVNIWRASATSPGHLDDYIGDPPQFPVRSLTQGAYRNRDLDPICGVCNTRKNRYSRIHHSQVTDKCVVRLDHHCFFLDKSIGHLNFCFFVRVLIFGWTSSFLGLVVCGLRLSSFLQHPPEMQRVFSMHSAGIIVLALLTVCLIPAALLQSLFLYAALEGAVCNTTLVECAKRNATYPPGEDDFLNFDVEWSRNLAQVFGHNWKWRILLPLGLPVDDFIDTVL